MEASTMEKLAEQEKRAEEVRARKSSIVSADGRWWRYRKRLNTIIIIWISVVVLPVHVF
jgi:hypothetical protein